MKLLILNGPNLNLLGLREPQIYGNHSYHDLCNLIEAHAAQIGVGLEIRQSNHEGVLVDWIQECYGTVDGIVMNPGAYTHYSVAVLDALKSVSLPAVEVHISNIHQREPFRHQSLLSAVCRGVIAGFGLDSYRLAVEALRELRAQF